MTSPLRRGAAPLRLSAAIAACFVFLATSPWGAAEAQDLDPGGVETGDAPRNVIPWLREALEDDVGAPAAASAPPAAPPTRKTAPKDVFSGVFGGSREEQDAPKSREAPGTTRGYPLRSRGAASSPSSVEVGRLKAVDGAAAGLLSAKDAALPPNAWRGASAEEAMSAMARLKPAPYRSVNRLTIRTLTAALAAPDDAEGKTFLKARIDALSRFGALKESALLAATASGSNLALGADAALVSGHETEICAGLTARPNASLARIYCQAISGDTLGAALSIEAARALGRSDEVTLALLEAVADPSAAQHLSAKEKQAKPTPLRLAAQRALGLSPPASFARDAPLTLLPAALNDKAPPRLRLEAMERLEAAGAIETETVAKAFGQYKSAESGGVWGRVEAYRKTLNAKDDAFAAAISAALKKADAEGRGGTMRRLLAPEIAKRALPVSGATPDVALTTRPLRKVLRTGEEIAAAVAVGRAAARLAPVKPGADPVEAALDYLSEPKWPGAWTPEKAQALAAAAPGDARAAFLQAALERLKSSDPGGASDAAAEIAKGRAALVAYRAMANLGELVRPSDPAAPQVGLGAIAAFAALGWRAEARALAVELAETL